MSQAHRRIGSTGQAELTLDDVPHEDADLSEISEWAHTFGGYAHFEDAWNERVDAVRDRFEATGALPQNVDDLRGCLFLEFRRDRFTWYDFETSVDGRGRTVHTVVDGLNTARQHAYKRVLLQQIRVLLSGVLRGAAGGHPSRAAEGGRRGD